MKPVDASAVDRLARVRVLVVGDLFLDRMIFGRVARVSREAPVPVLEETRQLDLPGGGTAPALNVVALGGTAWQVGVVGADADGERLCDLLRARGVGGDGIVVDVGRPTTVKTRVVAEGILVYPQQVARIDRIDRTPVGGTTEAALIAAIRAAAPNVDAILVSDYRSGVVTPAVIAAVRDAAGDRLLTTTDAQGEPERYAGFGLVKCNQAEAEQALGEAVTPAALVAWRQRLGCGLLAVTRGGDSALLAHAGGVEEVPAANRSEVYDVTGAGDTVIAILTAALATGAPPRAALELAQFGGGLAVRKWGNVPVSAAELARAVAAGA